MTPEAAKFKAEDAKNLLNNELFKEAFKTVADYLEGRALSCDPDNKDQAQRVIITKQLLAGLKREIERHVEDGFVADFRIAELEKKKLFSVFRR